MFLCNEKKKFEVGGCEAILIKCFRLVSRGERWLRIERWANMFRIVKLTTLIRLQLRRYLSDG